MSITTVAGGGAFTKKNIDDINANFADLSGSTAGGTLTAAHLLVGDATNVATDVAVTGDVDIDDAGVTSIADGITTHKLVAGVGAAYVVARGSTALDGSNPTPVTTGLSTVVSATISLRGSAAPGVGTSVLTQANTNWATGALAVYGWKVTATGDCTLVASTGTETFDWVAVGTVA